MYIMSSTFQCLQYSITLLIYEKYSITVERLTIMSNVLQYCTKYIIDNAYNVCGAKMYYNNNNNKK